MVTTVLKGWLVLFLMLTDVESGVRRSGPFKVEVEKLTECDDEGTGEIVWGTKITKTSDGKYAYNNPVYYGHPLDQNFTLYVELQVFSNGGYRPRYIQHTFIGCEEVWKYFKNLYRSFYQSAGVTVDHCPMPAGNFTTKDLELNTQKMNNMQVMMYNKYRALIMYYYKGKKTGCITVYEEVVPK